MSRDVLIETITPNIANVIIESAENTKSAYLSGIFMQAEITNGNNRVYPLHEISSAVNQINEQIADDVVIDRQKLADSGLVMLVIQIDKSEHKLISKPKIISYGLVPDRDDKAFSIEMEGVIDQFIVNAKAELLENARALENEVRQVVRKHIYRQMKKYPTIVPTIFMM